MKALDEEEIIEVACGCESATYAVTAKGTLYQLGYLNCDPQFDRYLSPSASPPYVLDHISTMNIVSVSTSYYHSACITSDGELYTWGHDGWDGMLGHGDHVHSQMNPKLVEALNGVNAKSVSCGRKHTAVCTKDGEVYTFGCGKDGQLGHGDTKDKTSPALVQALEGKHITQVQCGQYHTMALTSSGYVFTWGSTKHGQLGHGKSKVKYISRPCLIEGFREQNVLQITSTEECCAVLVDPSPSPIRQSQQASFNKKELSDVVIMVENEPLYANAALLSRKSDYFEAMFRCNMRESIERVVEVPNCSKAVFLQVLEYFYLDGSTLKLQNLVELWQMADIYLLKGLKFSILGALERGLSEENVSQILKEAEGLNCECDELKRLCLTFTGSKNMT